MHHSLVLAANQPNYWPSLSFWHKLFHSDIFVILDDAQFSNQDFHHRQRIRTNSITGYSWLTIPVHQTKLPLKEIQIKNDAKIKSYPWYEYHLHMLTAHYNSTPYFSKIHPFLKHLYTNSHINLVDFNLEIIFYVLNKFNILTKIVKSSELNIDSSLTGSLRIAAICKKLGAEHYLSGLGAKKQKSFDPQHFTDNNIQLKWLDFSHPLYNQAYQPFLKNMGCIDALCCIDQLFLP